MTKGPRQLRILHVIDSLDSSGGAEQQLLANLNHFTDPSLKHGLVIVQGTPASRNDEIPNHIPLDELFDHTDTVTRSMAVRRLSAFVRDQKPDLIHASLPTAALAARLAGLLNAVPVIESLVNISHEFVRVIDNPSVSVSKLRMHRLLDGVTMRSTKAFHAISDVVADSWIKTVKIPAHKVRVIPRSVELGNVRVVPETKSSLRSSVLSEFGFPADTLLVTAIGRVEPQKGHRYLVEAASHLVAEIPNIRVIVVGRPGLSSDDVVGLVEELGLDQHVKFVGPRRDISRLLAASEVFAFPSLYEGLGVALIEAMAVGVPIVTSDKRPMNDLITNRESGLLVPTRDPQALARAIGVAITNDRLRERITQGAFERIEQLPTPAEVARRFEAWYRELLV